MKWETQFSTGVFQFKTVLFHLDYAHFTVLQIRDGKWFL